MYNSSLNEGDDMPSFCPKYLRNSSVRCQVLLKLVAVKWHDACIAVSFVKKAPDVSKQRVLVHAGLFLLFGTAFWGQPSHSAQPKIVEVPVGPAFVTLPGTSEITARSGQALRTNAVLRTSKPGRMQVMLGNGRQFRMGGNAELRLGATNVELLKGSIIGWIKAGTPRSNPFTIKTRLATASIQGTTVFIELTDQKFKIFSWEGTVQVETENGQYFTLRSGQQLLLDLKRQMAEVSHQLDGLESALGTIGGVTTQPSPSRDRYGSVRPRQRDEMELNWEPPQPISIQDAERRLQKSQLINGFSTPLDTLPEIERELGVSAPSP